jgi:hypothetical protein
MLSNLKDNAAQRTILDDEGVQHGGEIVGLKLHIDDSTHDLGDLTNQLAISSFVGAPLLLEGFEVEGVMASLRGKGSRTSKGSSPKGASARPGE